MNATFYYSDGRILDYHDGSQDIIHIIWENGTEEFYTNGKLHKEDGPALIHEDGSREYWINGQRRSANLGPSIEWADGTIEYATSNE